MQMIERGHGIGIMPTFIAYRSIATGELVTVLDDYSQPPINMYTVYPQSRYLANKTRLFIEFLADYFGDTPYWDSELPDSEP